MVVRLRLPDLYSLEEVMNDDAIVQACTFVLKSVHCTVCLMLLCWVLPASFCLKSTRKLTGAGRRTFGAAFPPVMAFTQSNTMHIGYSVRLGTTKNLTL